ncbi:hypothetical protein [Streptomyces sp. NPDC001978]
MGPRTGPGTWRLRFAFLGLLIAAPGVVVGSFEGFQDGRTPVTSPGS